MTTSITKVFSDEGMAGNPPTSHGPTRAGDAGSDLEVKTATPPTSDEEYESLSSEDEDGTSDWEAPELIPNRCQWCGRKAGGKHRYLPDPSLIPEYALEVTLPDRQRSALVLYDGRWGPEVICALCIDLAYSFHVGSVSWGSASWDDPSWGEIADDQLEDELPTRNQSE
ncbi:hypothetical protein H0H93_006609 [Arthromyces matolae]|nr:hypothetical protein H0H93_006609 [Arthromyces matolae]